MVLHGHLHETKDYLRKGIRFINSGGSIKSFEKNSVAINFILVTEKEISTEVHLIKEFSANPVIMMETEVKVSDYEKNEVLTEAAGF